MPPVRCRPHTFPFRIERRSGRFFFPYFSFFHFFFFFAVGLCCCSSSSAAAAAAAACWISAAARRTPWPAADDRPASVDSKPPVGPQVSLSLSITLSLSLSLSASLSLRASLADRSVRHRPPGAATAPSSPFVVVAGWSRWNFDDDDDDCGGDDDDSSSSSSSSSDMDDFGLEAPLCDYSESMDGLNELWNSNSFASVSFFSFSINSLPVFVINRQRTSRPSPASLSFGFWFLFFCSLSFSTWFPTVSNRWRTTTIHFFKNVFGFQNLPTEAVHLNPVAAAAAAMPAGRWTPAPPFFFHQQQQQLIEEAGERNWRKWIKNGILKKKKSTIPCPSRVLITFDAVFFDHRRRISRGFPWFLATRC